MFNMIITLNLLRRAFACYLNFLGVIFSGGSKIVISIIPCESSLTNEEWMDISRQNKLMRSNLLCNMNEQVIDEKDANKEQ